MMASKAAEAVVSTTAGSSISAGIWTLVGIAVVAICGMVTAAIKQWGPWKKIAHDAREADFTRLREDIETLTNRIGVLEAKVEAANAKASAANEHAMRSDAKLHSALTACEVLLSLVEREMPEAKEIPLVKRLLAQAASDDMGIGDGMRKLAAMPAREA